jgi:hypothetical protein
MGGRALWPQVEAAALICAITASQGAQPLLRKMLGDSRIVISTGQIDARPLAGSEVFHFSADVGQFAIPLLVYGRAWAYAERSIYKQIPGETL